MPQCKSWFQQAQWLRAHCFKRVAVVPVTTPFSWTGSCQFCWSLITYLSKWFWQHVHNKAELSYVCTKILFPPCLKPHGHTFLPVWSMLHFCCPIFLFPICFCQSLPTSSDAGGICKSWRFYLSVGCGEAELVVGCRWQAAVPVSAWPGCVVS